MLWQIKLIGIPIIKFKIACCIYYTNKELIAKKVASRFVQSLCVYPCIFQGPIKASKEHTKEVGNVLRLSSKMSNVTLSKLLPNPVIWIQLVIYCSVARSPLFSFLEKKNFQMYSKCLNFSWSPWKSISEQLITINM